eukprot:775729-Amphidinium_carterae.1
MFILVLPKLLWCTPIQPTGSKRTPRARIDWLDEGLALAQTGKWQQLADRALQLCVQPPSAQSAQADTVDAQIEARSHYLYESATKGHVSRVWRQMQSHGI